MITNGVGKKFREEMLLGIHTLSEGGADVVKAALYGPDADIGPDLDAYTSDGEIGDVGAYVSGGLPVSLTVVGATGSSRVGGPQFEVPYAQPTDDLEVSPLAGVGVRGLLLYNASQNNRNIFTLDFGETKSPSAGLIVRWAVTDVVNFQDVLIPLVGGIV